jgi:zinc protease
LRQRPSLLRSLTPLVANLLVAALASCVITLASPGVPVVRKLSNGLTVVLLEDHTLPLVAVSLWVGAGSKHEIDSSAGYAHFLEHIIQRGTGTAGQHDYQKRANRWGGSLVVRSDYDRTRITTTGVPSSIEDQIATLVDLALHANLEDEQIDLELGALSREMKNYYDAPSSVTFLETMRAAFPNHPYRVPMLGSFRTLGRLKRPALSAFYRNLYVPNNMALAVAGDVDPAEVNRLIDAAFGKATKSATLTPPPDPPAEFAGHDDIEKRLALKEAWTTLSFVGPGYRHPDRPAVEVLVRALGDESLTPLGAMLRREDAGTGAHVSYHGLEDAGLIYIAVQPISALRSFPAATAVVSALIAFKERGLEAEELEATVRRLLSEERIRAEKLSERAERLSEAALFGGIRYYWNLPEVYSRLTVDEVMRVARKYLVVENLRLVIILPEKTRPFTEEEKDRFHDLLFEFGSSPPATLPGFSDERYNTKQAASVNAGAWGNWRDAAGLSPPTRTTLDNGLTVIVQGDRRHSMASASLHLRFGSRDDPADRNGLAFLAGRLLASGRAGGGKAGDQGGASWDGSARLDVRVMRDLTEVRILTTPERFRDSLSRLSVTLEHPSFEASRLAAARAIARYTLERSGRDPGTVAMDLFREKAYGGHPYSHAVAGNTAGLEKTTAEDLERFLERRLQPQDAVLALSGDVGRPTAAIDMVRDLFGDWRGAAESDSRDGDDDPKAPPRGRAGEFDRLMETSLSHVVVGVPAVAVGHPDFGVLRQIGTALTVLGSENMVFDRQAAFSLSVLPEGLEEHGALAISLQAPHTRRAEALFDMQRLMRRLTLRKLGEKDVGDFMQIQVGRQTLGLQGVMALASHLSYREAVGLDALKFRRELDPSLAAPPAKIKEVAERYLRPESWIVVKVGPSSP